MTVFFLLTLIQDTSSVLFSELTVLLPSADPSFRKASLIDWISFSHFVTSSRATAVSGGAEGDDILCVAEGGVFCGDRYRTPVLGELLAWCLCFVRLARFEIFRVTLRPTYRHLAPFDGCDVTGEKTRRAPNAPTKRVTTSRCQ